MENNNNEFVVDYAGVVITKSNWAELQKATAEINSATTTIKLHPELDIKLSILAKRIQHLYHLPNRNGINRTNLAYLLLKKALADVTIE